MLQGGGMLSRGPKTKKMCRKPYGFSVLLASSLLSSGCATNQYMGISLKPGAADPVVQALAVKAQGGDKQSQYELGRWFEDSVDPNALKKATRLYRIAATPRGGMQLLYTSGSSGVNTSVISAGPKIEANKAAEIRLRQVAQFGKEKDANGVRNDLDSQEIATKKQMDHEASFFPDMLPCAAKTPYRQLSNMASYIVEGNIKYRFVDQKKQENYTGSLIYAGYYDIEIMVTRFIKWGLLPQKESIYIKQYDIWPEHRCPSWGPTSVDAEGHRIFVLRQDLGADERISFFVVASYDERGKL
jgi:hypothetical protein